MDFAPVEGVELAEVFGVGGQGVDACMYIFVDVEYIVGELEEAAALGDDAGDGFGGWNVEEILVEQEGVGAFLGGDAPDVRLRDGGIELQQGVGLALVDAVEGGEVACFVFDACQEFCLDVAEDVFFYCVGGVGLRVVGQCFNLLGGEGLVVEEVVVQGCKDAHEGCALPFFFG